MEFSWIQDRKLGTYEKTEFFTIIKFCVIIFQRQDMVLQPHGVQNRANIPTPLTAESTRTLHSDMGTSGSGIIDISTYLYSKLLVLFIMHHADFRWS